MTGKAAMAGATGGNDRGSHGRRGGRGLVGSGEAGGAED